ncbi:MAG: SDR family NAD(P)-dependent oxidoreductase [Planctomycetota bacterium]
MAAPVALVTGSGKRRVGSVVADALADRGYSLVIHYRQSAAEAQQAVSDYQRRGVQALAIAADLTDASAVDALLAQTLAHFGRLDVLVHAAAIWPRQTLEQITADDLRQNWEVNTLATFLCVQKAGLAMVKQPTGGAIVTIGDWATVRPYRDYAAYFASKGSIPTITRTMASELAARNPQVRVNCIMPGPVMLPDDLSAAERAEAIAGTLVKREGSPRHIALAALHFIDNDFVTGAVLPVDGGRSIHSES